LTLRDLCYDPASLGAVVLSAQGVTIDHKAVGCIVAEQDLEGASGQVVVDGESAAFAGRGRSAGAA
jgi:hypothetical protein